MAGKDRAHFERLRAEAQRRYDMALAIDKGAVEKYRWGPAQFGTGGPVILSPLTSLCHALTGLADARPTHTPATLSLGPYSPATRGASVGRDTSRLIDDYVYFPPPESAYAAARELFRDIPKDNRFLPAINHVAVAAQKARAKNPGDEKIIPKGVQEVLIAAFDLPRHDGFKVRWPDPSFLDQIKAFLEGIAHLAEDLYKIARGMAGGDLGDTLAGAQGIWDKMSPDARDSLKRAGLSGWFGPPPAPWAADRLELWKLIQDLAK